MKSGIYCIENLNNGKLYIGLSNDIHKRKICHFSLLKRNKHHNNHLQNAYNNNEPLEHRVIEICKCEDLVNRETYWINYYDCIAKGYNQAEAGGIGNGLSGKEHPNHISTIHTFYHDVFGTKECSMLELDKEFNLGGSDIYSLVKGKRNQVKGWRMTKDKVWLNKYKYDFIHDSGIVETGLTQKELANKYELDSAGVNRMVKGKIKSTKGWKLKHT